MDGTLDLDGGLATVRFVRHLSHPVDKVWRAITQPEHLAAWFPQEVTFDGPIAAGTTVRFTFGDGAHDAFTGTIEVVDAPRLLVYTWGTDRLRFELEPDGDGTRLTFSDEFDEVGKAARDTAGWHVCLDGLTRSLDGEAADPSNEDRWRTVHAGYVEAFPPEASTIGPPT